MNTSEDHIEEKKSIIFHLLSANCKVGGNKIDIGDSFSVKVPKKEADVIFVIEQQIPNDKVYKEMITPLMSELREELKQQGIT